MQTEESDKAEVAQHLVEWVSAKLPSHTVWISCRIKIIDLNLLPHDYDAGAITTELSLQLMYLTCLHVIEQWKQAQKTGMLFDAWEKSRNIY